MSKLVAVQVEEDRIDLFHWLDKKYSCDYLGTFKTWDETKDFAKEFEKTLMEEKS